MQILIFSLLVTGFSFVNAAFQIDFQFSGSVTEEQKTSLKNGAAKWTNIITTGFGSTVTLKKGTTICNQGALANDIAIKDLLIFVSVEPLDGTGGNLIRTGPCAFDQNKKIRAAQMQIDSADVNTLKTAGKLDTALTHEVGHALGFGTGWEINGKALLQDIGAPFNTLDYIGAFGSSGNGEVGASGRVQVETGNIPGVSRLHWRKDVYKNELMTATITGNSQPLSKLTAFSLADLGYTVNVNKADTFNVNNPDEVTAAPVTNAPTSAGQTRPPTKTPTTAAPTNLPTKPPTLATSAPITSPPPPQGAVLDSERISFLTNNAGSLNNGVVVPLTDPRVIPIKRTRTAAEGCAIQGNGFICADLARNIRCVNGLVGINVANPFNQNNLLKACVGGFCGGTPGANPVAGQNPCFATAAQAVAAMNSGNEFFLPPPNPGRRLGERELQTFYDGSPSEVGDLNWEEGFIGTTASVVAVPDVDSGAVAGGVIGGLSVLGLAAAFFVVQRRKSQRTQELASSNPSFGRNDPDFSKYHNNNNGYNNNAPYYGNNLNV